ncbi:MAG: hypothetical protein IIA67_05395 [Planctomycetes bacterium]|nr:hypothetical protein [Planctomycetota bacterium]
MNYLKPSLLTSLAGLLLLGLLGGCSWLKTPEVQMQPGSQRSGLESATVVYKLSRRAATGSTPSEGDLQTLSIIYPHPQKGRGYALAELLVIRSRQNGGPDDHAANYSSWDPRGWADRFGDAARRTMPGVALGKGIKEAKAIDLPKGELDGIFSRLERTGFFTNDSAASLHASTAGAFRVDLTAVINGARFEKPWSRVDALDELLRRVRSKGRLITYRRSAADSHHPSPSSAQPPEQLYRQLAQRRANRGAPGFDTPRHSWQAPQSRISRLPPIDSSK